MTWKGKFIGLVLALTVVVGGPYMMWAWPTVDEAKIVDASNKIITGTTNDQFRIETVRADTGKVYVYRNDDAPYVFPFFFYLKWDSQDLNTRAKSYAGKDVIVCVRSYGWRVPFMSWFPNATSLWAKEGDSC
ncbi:MAG: DUF1523 family protein [Parcubacteria group bacterium]|nr:DUF1523 family protein [Parcubacteria group bacterium]